MSQRLTRTPRAPDYVTYNGQINNSHTSGDSSYVTATDNYSSCHHHQSAPGPSGQVSAQSSQYDNHRHTGSYGGVHNPLSATQNSVQPYPPPTNHYHAPYHTIPAAGTIQASTPYYTHDPSFEKYSNHYYTSATMQSSAEYSSGLLAASTMNATTMNATILQPMPYPAAHPMPHVDPHTRPSKPIHSPPSPQEGSSRHATSSRRHARTSSPHLLPREWYQPSGPSDQSGSRSSDYASQPAAQDPGPSNTVHDKNQHKPRRASKSSKLDAIPKHQLQRFRVVVPDLGPNPSSSGTKRTRSPGSDALPDAKARATIQSNVSGARKGKSKAGLSPEEKEVAAKRKKEADRVQAYRNSLENAYTELRTLLYPDEEKSRLVPSNHGKQKCIRDAIERVRHWQQREARLEAQIRTLEAGRQSELAERHALVAENNAYKQLVGELREMVDYLRNSLASVKDNQA